MSFKNNIVNKEDDKISSNDSNVDSGIIKDFGQILLNNNERGYKIHLLNIIGEIEGHENLSPMTKTSKYEHIIPMLAAVEENKSIDGLLVLLNTVGGDVESGLAIAEMISSISKPKVCLVLGGGHSIGVPLAVSGDVTFIAQTATMIVHPIRVGGMVLGVKQNFEYIEKLQDRILDFTVSHSNVEKSSLKELMFNTKELTKDIGSILVGEQAVKIGLINKVGGIKEALNQLYDLINLRKNSKIS
ncbi:MAG: ATP-dependent Clp protease proteolytic subunit [Lachnospiraceae bacterium]|nr:ATP-dependent Clp protease proteolytic subunit [Lachnospiraceae bacterium]